MSDDKEFIERVRKAKNREVMSEFIRIGQSDLYDYEPVRRALLKEIAFLQVHDEQTKIPKHSPFKGQYEGWCYASQRFLANRVGSTEGYVRNCIALMEKDGVIVTRLWHDPLGYPHQEMHVEEEVVTAHQRDEDYMEHERKAPRRGGNKQPNKGSFQLGNKVRATAHDSRSHRTPQPNATALGSRKPPHSTAVLPPHTTAVSDTAVGCDKYVVCLEGNGLEGNGLGGKVLEGTTTASGLASSPSALRAGGQRDSSGSSGVSSHQNLKVKTSRGEGDMDKGNGMAKVRGDGQSHVVKQLNKPLPNRLCYPEAFKNWMPGMKVPKCKRCDSLLHPNENHQCEGYVPKYATLDYERREANREALLEDRWDRSNDRDIAMDTFGSEEL
jgi:hypothetical protein